MPDLNSLPPSSPSPSASPLQQRIPPAASLDLTRAMSSSPPASHTPPHSLAAAAAMNAGIQNEDARRPSTGSMRQNVERARRRSSIRMNINLNDPAVPAPGEMQMSPSARTRAPWPPSPHHERAPSLGELHQELEYEQEGQVNRLLNMIRQQQTQIDTLQSNQPTSAVDDSTPTSERSMSLGRSHTPTHPSYHPHSQPPSALPSLAQPRSRSPYGNIPSRHSSIADRSRGSSHIGSPALRPMPGGPSESSEWLPGSAGGVSRDESTFYQAETQNLTRENQMLKLRIRELERQLSELNPTAGITHTPVRSSSLAGSPPITRGSTSAATDNSEPPSSTG